MPSTSAAAHSSAHAISTTTRQDGGGAFEILCAGLSMEENQKTITHAATNIRTAAPISANGRIRSRLSLPISPQLGATACEQVCEAVIDSMRAVGADRAGRLD